MQPNIASGRGGGIAIVQTGTGNVRIWIGDFDASSTLRAYAKELDITEQALVSFFRMLGDDPVAADLLESRLEACAQRYHRILDDLRSFRPENEAVEAARVEAIAAVENGELDRADDLLNRAYAIWRESASRLLDRSDTASTNGVELLVNRAELAVSRQSYAEAMAAFEEACGLLPSRLNGPLARCKRVWGIAELEWGRFSEAYNILSDARKLDSDGWSSELDAISALATAARELGRHEEAERLLRETTAMMSDPVQQATLLIEMSAVTREAGNLGQARVLIDSATAILGDHSPLSNQRIRLEREAGRILDESGDIVGGLRLVQKALEHSRDTLSPAHPLARRVALDCAGLLWRSGRLDEAEALYREVETAIETEFGSKHPELVTVLDHLGTFYMERACFAEAAEVLKRGYVVAEERLTRDHPDRAQVLNNLGRAMLNLGEFDSACESFEEAAKILDWRFGKEHKDYATVLANRAVALFNLGRLDEAIGQGTEALHLREAALGLSHPDVAESLATLGALHHQRDELDHAEKLLARAQRIYESIAPGHSVAFSQLLFNQASLYLDSMRPVLAAKSTEQALSLALPIFGEDHPRIVQFLETLAVAQALSDDRESALQTLARATATAERLWDEKHSVTQRLRALEVQVRNMTDCAE